jgi:hypothetical protein
MGEKDNKIIKWLCIGCIGIIVIFFCIGYVNERFIKPSLVDPDKKIDADHDGYSKYFEGHVMGTSDNVPNMRYFVLVSTYGLFDKGSYDIAKISLNNAREFALKNRVPAENIIVINAATYSDFSKNISNILKKANENDTVFIELHGHTDEKVSFVKENFPSNEQFSDKNYYDFYETVGYDKIANLIEENQKPTVIFSNDGCFGGKMIGYVNSPNISIMTQVNEKQYSMAIDMLDFFFNSYGLPLSKRQRSYEGNYPGAAAFKYINPDVDNNGGISVAEAFDVAKTKIASVWYDYANPGPREPMLSNRELANKTYLFETDSKL